MIDLKHIELYVESHFVKYGVNKKREVTRLLYEITRRDKCSIQKVMEGYDQEFFRFCNVKKFLMKKRYPDVKGPDCASGKSFPQLKVDPANEVCVDDKRALLPKHFYIEEQVLNYPLVKKLKENFSNIPITQISTYKEYTRNRPFTILDYNQRVKDFYIVKENFQFSLPCPCTPSAIGCGYHVLNLGYGCGFECTYCFLQAYSNGPGIIVPANIEDFFEKEFKKWEGQKIRLGSGQFMDSLIFDHITEFSPYIVTMLKQYPHVTFELKTKSDRIDLLLSVEPVKNLVVAWSLNPQNIIETVEFYTASLKSRLASARKCADHGYQVAFHFDPIIYYEGWEKDYQGIVEDIFSQIDSSFVAWISLGTLRMPSKLKQVMENRFPNTSILNETLVSGYDDKLRYPFDRRVDIYEKMTNWIKSKAPQVPTYLCMENQKMWEEVGLNCLNSDSL